jgi:hypothetical protein
MMVSSTAFAATNLLTNGDAQTGDFTGWTLINFGSGWAHEDMGVGNHAFVSSYYETYSGTTGPSDATVYCIMTQEVDLVSKGYSPSYLDSSPRVDISAASIRELILYIILQAGIRSRSSLGTQVTM